MTTKKKPEPQTEQPSESKAESPLQTQSNQSTEESSTTDLPPKASEDSSKQSEDSQGNEEPSKADSTTSGLSGQNSESQDKEQTQQLLPLQNQSQDSQNASQSTQSPKPAETPTPENRTILRPAWVGTIPSEETVKAEGEKRKRGRPSKAELEARAQAAAAGNVPPVAGPAKPVERKPKVAPVVAKDGAEESPTVKINLSKLRAETLLQELICKGVLDDPLDAEQMEMLKSCNCTVEVNGNVAFAVMAIAMVAPKIKRRLDKNKLEKAKPVAPRQVQQQPVQPVPAPVAPQPAQQASPVSVSVADSKKIPVAPLPEGVDARVV